MDHNYRTLWLSGQLGSALDELTTGVMSTTRGSLQRLHGITETWTRRYRTALQFTAPSIASSLGIYTLEELSKLSVLEVGCGEGAKSVALSNIFGSYTGIDINAAALRIADRAAATVRRENVRFRLLEANGILDFIEAEGSTFDVYILYAVVEHLTIPERLRLLRGCWKHLKDGGVLLIGELPNRLCPVDHHSSYLAFFDCLPEELAMLYGERSSREYFKRRLYSSATPGLELYRIGRGASYHEFELSIADCQRLASHIILDSWSTTMVNHQPIRQYERTLMRTFQTIRNDSTTSIPLIPSGFARYWIDMTLRKREFKPLPAPFFVEPALVRGHTQESLGTQFYKTEQPLVIGAPPGVTSVTIGFLRQSLASEITILAGDTVLFQESGQTLSAATGDHWSPHVYKRVELSSPTNLRIKSAARDAFVGNVFFR